MRKIYILFWALLFNVALAFGQTYSGWGVTLSGADYDTIDTYGDTLRFTFSGILPGGFGNAKLVVYREGDFGDPVEYLDVWEENTTTYLGNVPSYASGIDCDAEDSTEVLFNAAMIDTWQSGGMLSVKVLPSLDVDMFCTTSRVKVRLEYGYCVFGVPVEYANFTFSTNTTCSTGSPVTMTGSPTGGTFSGLGVSGNQFNPAGLSPGNHTVYYTATDLIGCTTVGSGVIKILNQPAPIMEVICEGASPVVNMPKPHGFFTDVTMTNALDTTTSFVIPPVTTSPTTYYYAYYDQSTWFVLDTAMGTNVVIVDHDAYTSDDRGGYAFTDSTVYIVGDGYTARYDLDLSTTPVQLPVRDALFTNLANGKIYSLYNSFNAEMPFSWPSDFTVDAVVALDADLNPTSDITMLSSPIYLSTFSSQNGIFSGYGVVLIKSGDNDEVFEIDLATGAVTSFGIHSINLFWGENWFDWGVAGNDGSDYYIYYRSWSSPNILAHNLTTDVITPITNFSDVSDMAGFIYNPSNNRLYFHYEGSGQFGGTFETFGYMDASHSILNPGSTGLFGCPSPIEYTFNSVDLGPDTTVCREDGYVLEPGLGFNSYTWNGVTNNWNVYPVSESGTYTVEVEDNVGCILTDQVVIDMTWCSLGAEELSALDVNAYPVPNNGEFTLNLGTPVSGLIVEMYDIQGKVVYSEVFSGVVSSVNITAGNVDSGLYMLWVKTGSDARQIPIVVNK